MHFKAGDDGRGGLEGGASVRDSPEDGEHTSTKTSSTFRKAEDENDRNQTDTAEHLWTSKKKRISHSYIIFVHSYKVNTSVWLTFISGLFPTIKYDMLKEEIWAHEVSVVARTAKKGGI